MQSLCKTKAGTLLATTYGNTWYDEDNTKLKGISFGKLNNKTIGWLNCNEETGEITLYIDTREADKQGITVKTYCGRSELDETNLH